MKIFFFITRVELGGAQVHVHGLMAGLPAGCQPATMVRQTLDIYHGVLSAPATTSAAHPPNPVLKPMERTHAI